MNTMKQLNKLAAVIEREYKITFSGMDALQQEFAGMELWFFVGPPTESSFRAVYSTQTDYWSNNPDLYEYVGFKQEEWKEIPRVPTLEALFKGCQIFAIAL